MGWKLALYKADNMTLQEPRSSIRRVVEDQMEKKVEDEVKTGFRGY